MKSILFATCLSLGLFLQADAQTLKEMKKMMKESVSSKPDTTGLKQVEVKGGDDQFVMAEAFYNSGKKFFKATLQNSNIWPNTTPVPSADLFREVIRDDKGRISKFSGYVVADGPYPLFYKGSSYNNCVFTGKFMIYHPVPYSTPEEVEKAFEGDNCPRIDVYHPDKSVIKNITKEEVKNEWMNYLKQANVYVSKIRETEKANADKAEAEKRAKFTTQNRNVTKLKVYASAQKFEQGKSYTFFVTATLKDGSEISTEKGGYIDEYEVSWSGLPEMVNGPFGKVKAIYGSTITIPDTEPIKGDKVTLTVKSKYYPSVSATVDFAMDYSGYVTLDYNAQLRSDAVRVTGGNIRVEIKAVKHGVTGENLIECKAINPKDGSILRHFRINEGSGINVETCGQKGWNASSSKPAQDGTHGGDITIVIDPSVKSYNINTRNTGGRGGSGSSQYPRAGANGSDGRVEKLNQKVSW
ncbi:MAG: hypothetical protein K1X56_11835 [Flavobacteriales bacterium]|nr:hypothetical protein [Flavobacteriales bacterium]